MKIISRLEESIEAGRFKPIPIANKRKIKTIADLTKGYEDFFGENCKLLQSSTYSLRGRFKSIPRQSFRTLPLPAKTEAPAKLLASGLFDSIAAIWAFYEKHGLANPLLTQGTVCESGFWLFIEPFWKHCENYWPIATHMEMIDDFSEMDCLELFLPYVHGDEPHAGMFEAFLEGPEQVAGQLIHLDQGACLELTAADRELVETETYTNLLKHYSETNSEKKWDFKKLSNWYEVFFSAVEEKYPQFAVDQIPVIAWDSGCIHPITCLTDIEFAFDYCDAFHAMCSAIPDCYEICEGEGNDAEEFVAEICRVWREDKK